MMIAPATTPTASPVSPDRSPAVTRRRLIGRLAAAGFSAPVIGSILAKGTWAQDATPDATPTGQEILASIGKDPRLIQHGTTTFETPVELMDAFLTPNDRFFVRSNGPVSIDLGPAAWRLSVTGLVHFAWSGYGGITRVEVSVDDGATWQEADIVEEAGALSWVRFESPWDAQAGEAVLRSRATDARHLSQPDEVAWNAKGYGMNAVYAVPVTVTA